MAEKKFKTEVADLLQLIIHSLYSNKEIFLRELVSNASDAIDKLRYLSLTDEKYKDEGGEGRIDITYTESVPRTLTIKDNGLGMDEKELEEALDTAYEYDDKAVIEKALDDFREINCACVKIGGEILPSTLEEPVVWRDFLSFEDKYMSGKKGGSDRKVRDFPAQLDEKTGCEIQNMTAKVYAALALKGIVRCDYLIDRASGKVYFNEINTIPGSLAGYLYTDKGLTLKEIITEVVEECISTKRGAKEKGYSSGVLQYYAKGGSNACKSGAKKV